MPFASLLVSHHRMRAEQDRGRVRPLCRDIPEFCRWGGAWWILSADGWLRITDSHLASRLDRIAMRLDAAGEARALPAGGGREEAAWPSW